MTTKQQLENAARAMGHECHDAYLSDYDFRYGIIVTPKDGISNWFNPLSPTTQGKSDLLDLMLVLDIGHEVNGQYMYARRGDEAHDGYIERTALIRNGNKHAALAEAAVSVAAQIWESKNGNV